MCINNHVMTALLTYVCMKLSAVCLVSVHLCTCTLSCTLFMYRAYELLSKAVELGNLKAKRKMAYAYLVSTFSPTNVTSTVYHLWA